MTGNIALESDAPQRMRSAATANVKGHFSAYCRQRAVSSIQDGDTPDSAFLDTVLSSKSSWTTHIAINGTQLPFKLDSSTEVTAVSKDAWEMLEKPALQSPKKQLLDPHNFPWKWWNISKVISPTKENNFTNKSLSSPTSRLTYSDFQQLHPYS